MQCTDDIDGTVSLVNSDFGYFEIDNTRKVYMSIMLARGNIKKLPLIGSKVLIKKGHMLNSIYVVCLSSTLEGDFQTLCPRSPFLEFLETCALGPKDIAKFEEISNELKSNFTNVEVALMNDILLSLLRYLVNFKLEVYNEAFMEEICNNCIFSDISLTTIRTCKYVEIVSNRYTEFPYWSFGIHSNDRDRMLFGYLEINPMYGFYMIKDSHYKMACIITVDSAEDEKKLSELYNSYIVIRNYTVITEIYNQNNIPNIEYIVTSFGNVNRIHSKPGNSVRCEGVDYTNEMSFSIIKKSTVCVGVRGAQELLLQVSTFNSAGLFLKEAFFVLPSKYVCLNIDLREGASYIMYYKTALKEINRPELTRMKNLKIYELPISCYIKPTDAKMGEVPEPLNVLECKERIKNSRNLVTFRGIIRKKRFIDPLSSRTARIPTIYGFGTPGAKVHQIVFSGSDNIYLDCYLNNWENMLMPLGLIPDMEVIVRHVAPQSNKYVKSTIFTTFEVVSYKPCVYFNTANLYENEGETIPWNSWNFLSRGNQIPVSVLLWGKVTEIFVLKLSVSLKCVQCKKIVNTANHCDKDCELESYTKFNISDAHGKGSVSTKSLDVLRVLLAMDTSQFNKWISNVKDRGHYSYNYFERCTGEPCDYVTRYLENISEKKFFIDLKCRKMSERDPHGSRRPLWYCIDARD